jgi:3-methyl-2-oxobutanoate hydroxymethyltransferase
MMEGGADGVHLEGTRQAGVLIRAMVSAGIPVMGHIGITKQKIIQSGIFKLPGREADSARELINDAVEMATSGVFVLVLECLPARLAEIITRSLDVPTISIGSGIHCDGQALVTQDMLGLFKGVSPRFLKVYADIAQAIITALTDFRQEVESGVYPTPDHSYPIEETELHKLVSQLKV